MLKDSPAFSGFSVDDLEAAKRFYSQVLGLDVAEEQWGLRLNIIGSRPVFVYQKEDHTAATYTVLNFPVDDIDKAVDELSVKGVVFDQQDLGNGAKTDEKGVLRGRAAKMGPDIAWFKDPAGNILSILQDK